ncbi:MAG: UvrD-helicase domain-containing protein [Clostridia bacterium]|nr:UvrD-helicase domain-containing protein [Clostridia bacterium]
MTDKEYHKLKRELFDTYYADLNREQRAAVCTVRGPLLVLAGAGSGKTTVLVRRISHILRYGDAYADESAPGYIPDNFADICASVKSASHEELGDFLTCFAKDPCPPWAVLAITFTNKAARELCERLAQATGGEGVAEDIFAGTFHSVCLRILRRNYGLLGYRSGFSIYDIDDQKKLVAKCLREMNLDEKRFPPKAILNFIGRAKDKLQTPRDMAEEPSDDYLFSVAARVYELYQKKLLEANAMDFDDIIMQTVRLLRENADILSYYQSKFKYVAVDEYQDTNYAQFCLCELLAGKYKNIMAVGDDDQSIYKFRGATIENILNFDRTYPDAKIIKLEQNYRSTKMILDAANAVIANNYGRRGKNLWTAGDVGDKLTVIVAENQNDEARRVINTVIDLVQKENRPYRDFAILYRTNAQSQAFESAFAKSGIPYRVLGGLRFFDRKEVKDILAYLFLLANPDDNLRLLRIVNEPKRKIGAATLEAVEAIAAETGKSDFAVMAEADKFTALAKSAEKLGAFCALISELRAMVDTTELHLLVEAVITRTGYKQMLMLEGAEAEDRLENLDQLISMAADYAERTGEATLVGFLEEISLVADVDRYDESADAVVMMTMHSAKGLEFPVVFLPGMEEEIFPGMRAFNDPGEMEEERRLAYVAITRAKEKLFLLRAKERFAYGRTQYNSPSSFLKEIPDELCTKVGEVRRSFGVTAAQQHFTDTASYTRRGHTGASAPAAPQALATGDRVVHPTFGEGMILSASPMGADVLYEVVFDKVGTKRLMATFAKLKKI